MTTFVYLGPSLPRAEAENILQAVYMDPVAMGDLYTLMETRAKPGDRVAIIDGFFEQVPAVWHKEILYAMEKGVEVYGASSMGALRAAELHAFGMRGVGRVFEAYRDAVIEDDDEVAVAHATREDGYRSLSTAMVSLRFGLGSLLETGRITPAQHDSLCAYAKSQHYNVRSWADTYAYALGLGMDEHVLSALRDISVDMDAKAQDAVALLQYLAATADTPVAPQPPGFVLERTGFWRELERVMQARVVGMTLNSSLSSESIDSEVLGHVLAASPSREAVLREALLMRIATENAAISQVSPLELKAAMFRVASRNGLRTSADMRTWRDSQGLGDADWRRILEVDAQIHRMSLNAMMGLDPYLLTALKANGLYADAAANAESIRSRHGENWMKQLSAQDFGIEYVDLQRWYEQRHGPMLPDPESHAQALGFQSLAEFVTHILAQYLQAQDEAPGDVALPEASPA